MFQFKKLPAGTYTLQISYVGYKTYKEAVIIPSSGEKKVNVTMREDVNLLDEVSVNARATRAEQKGDSLLYNAEAFKVMQGSSAEDLLAKMRDCCRRWKYSGSRRGSEKGASRWEGIFRWRCESRH